MPHPLTRLYLWGAYRLPHTYRYMLLLLLPLVLCATDIAAHYMYTIIIINQIYSNPLSCVNESTVDSEHAMNAI